MKRFLLFALLMIFVNSIFSQQIDEWYWNESTLDAVYETPNSKFAKKWICPQNGEEFVLVLNANGTFRSSTSVDGGDNEFLDFKFSGTWNRKDKMVLEITYTDASVSVPEKVLSQYSARKRDMAKQLITQYTQQQRSKYVGKTFKYPIRRIDEDHLILKNERYRSERLRKIELENKQKEIEKRAAEKAEKERKAAEEAKKAAEEAKKAAEEARKAEEEMAKRAEEKRINAEKAYWEQMGAEKKASFDKAAAEGVALVDLGLSIRWADRNLGASSVSDKGEYYAWGEITPKTDTKSKYMPIVKPKSGVVLDASSDPATVRWGIGWHVPTVQQWKELFEKCRMKENDNHTGVVFTGPNGNSLTIPFTEYTYWAHYWANSIQYKGEAYKASVPRKAETQNVAGYTLKSSDKPKIDSIDVETLLPIRPVME